MALASGTRLGLYEIQTAIGAGGRARCIEPRDTKLHRDIALAGLERFPVSSNDGQRPVHQVGSPWAVEPWFTSEDNRVTLVVVQNWFEELKRTVPLK